MNLATRARVHTSDTATIRTWRARDTTYALVEVVSLYEHGRRRYLVVDHLPNGNQYIISRHRRKSAALKSLAGQVES